MNAPPVFPKILIVDDEPQVRDVLERILRRSAEQIVQASTVAEAVAALRDRVDLVFTDVRLGSESGVDVARAAAMLHPAPPVIAMSGQSDAAEVLALGKAGVAAFIAKPFTPKDVLGLLDNLQLPQHFELAAVIRRVVGAWNMPDVLDTVRRSMVLEALARTGGNKAQAAQLLGISRQHLQKIMARGRA